MRVNGRHVDRRRRLRTGSLSDPRSKLGEGKSHVIALNDWQTGDPYLNLQATPGFSTCYIICASLRSALPSLLNPLSV